MADLKPRDLNLFHLLWYGILGLVTNLVNPNMPAGRGLLYSVNQAEPNSVPEFPDLIEMAHKKLISMDQFTEFAGYYGFNKHWAARFYANAIEFLSVMDYITLWRRGRMSRESLDIKAALLKLNPDELENAIKVTEYFPAPADLVRFAVREVYTPDIAEKFGLFEDLPDKYMSEAKKAGLPSDQAKNYWGSHWELPSPLQGFAMLHRRIIDADTMKLLLRSLDVMPFWRDKMIQLSYNPLTRVDVRRMYGLGVLDEDGVRNAYLDVGYSPENADLMTTFTTRYENSEADGITRSNVVKAYVNSLITRVELKEYLELLRYDPKVIEFWLDSADYEKTEKYINIITEDAIELYRKGDITIDQIRDRLFKEDLPAEFVNKIINETLIQEAKRRKVPSKADLEHWLMSNIIDENYYTEKMRLIGYRDQDIWNFLVEIALKVDTSKRKLVKQEIYDRWFTNDIIDEAEYRKVLRIRGIRPPDIERRTQEILAAKE